MNTSRFIAPKLVNNSLRLYTRPALKIALCRKAAFLGPRPDTNCSGANIHSWDAAKLISTPTWLDTVTITCSTASNLSSGVRKCSNELSFNDKTSLPGPHNVATIANGF
eukprot:Gb_29266 [translate_table: standard]